MTQLALSDVHEEITTGFSTLTGSMEASERNIALTIKDNIEEIRTWGARHSDNMENLSTRLLQASRQRSLYKGGGMEFTDLPPLFLNICRFGISFQATSI